MHTKQRVRQQRELPPLRNQQQLSRLVPPKRIRSVSRSTGSSQSRAENDWGKQPATVSSRFETRARTRAEPPSRGLGGGSVKVCCRALLSWGPVAHNAVLVKGRLERVNTVGVTPVVSTLHSAAAAGHTAMLHDDDDDDLLRANTKRYFIKQL